MIKSAAMFFLVSLAARGASADDSAWKRQVEEKIDALTQEIERLKLDEGRAGAPAEEGSARPLPVSPFSLGPSAGKVYGVDRGVSLGGYGELIYQGFAHSVPDSLSDNHPRGAELDLARWVLYVGYRFSDSIVFNSELEIAHANSSKSGEAEAEFAYLDFALSKPIGLRVGELLLPVGLTNEYHEPVVFHGVLRPDVERFIIPTTWHENGAGYYGELGPFAYRGYLVAGLRAAADGSMNQIGFQPDIGLQEGQQEASRSRAHDLAYAQRLDYVGLPGCLLGGSVYLTNAGQEDRTPAGARVDAPVTLWEVHARGQWRGAELRALYTQATVGGVGEIDQANGLAGNQSAGQYLWGGYVEFAYDAMPLLRPGSRQEISPFARLELYDTQAEVPGGYARDLANDRRVYTLGLSYKPIPRVVLKADYQMRANHAGTGVDQFNLGAGYEF